MGITRRKDSKGRVLKEGEYERKNGTYEYRWRDKYGKRRNVYAKTLTEIREKEERVRRNVLNGITPDADNITVNDLYERWITLKRGLRGNTYNHYKYLYMRFAEQTFGRLKLADIRKSDVKAFYISVMDEQGVEVGTLGCIQTVLHQILQIAVDDNYIRENPSDGALRELWQRNAEKPKRRALTRSEQQVLEQYLEYSELYGRYQPVIMTMLYTGMRVGEATGLRWQDVDFDRGLISVNHTLAFYFNDRGTKMYRHIHAPKTSAGTRFIPILPIVETMLLKERSIQRERGIVCGMELDGYTDFIFLNENGNTVDYTKLDKILKHITKDCNQAFGKEVLPHFSCHSLRHTFATRLCELGVNIKAIQEIMGHTDIKVTMNIYTDISLETVKSEMNMFGKAYHRLTTEYGQDTEGYIGL